LAGATLSFIHDETAPVIELRILHDKIKPALYTLLRGVTYTNDPVSSRLILNSDKDKTGKKKLTAKVFIAKNKNNIVAVAFETSASGYGGNISVLSVFNLNTNKLEGARALDHKETKGLGARISNVREPFIKQFSDLTYDTPIKLKRNGGKVNAISGATFSSTGFTRAIEKARILLNKRKKEIFTAAEAGQ
jgi:electron transport complex protein RnfG